MNITQFAIERNRITFTVLITILLLGVTLFSELPRDSMPPYTIRFATIVSQFPGASPERVEQLVSFKIEKIAQELPELDEVSSTSRTGLSVVSVTLKDEIEPSELQDVWDRLRRKLNNMNDLPDGVYPQLNDDGIGDVYGIVVGLLSDGFSYSEMEEFADDIRDDLIKLEDAAKVEIGGLQEERIFIEFDNTQLAEYQLTSSRLQGIIASTNILSSGGEIYMGDESIILEPTGNYNSIDDIKQTLIPVGNQSQMISLEDITTISKGYINPANQLVRVNGLNALSLHVNLKDGANIIVLGQDVDRVMETWNSKLPVGLELIRLSSLDTYIDVKISDFIGNLIQSIVIVLALMLIFLGFRTGTIIASLIPIVTIMTLMWMGVINMGLNQVTLAALIMALGMMVDNAIVVAESIMVKVESGMDTKQAAIESCSELFTPLLISTLTTSAAFMSFYLATSVMGDIVGPIFVVITLALLSSWVIALTVVTLFCFYFLKVNTDNEKKLTLIDRVINWMKEKYRNLILSALQSKNLVILAIFTIFILSLFGFTKVAFLFFPDSDRNLITVDINLPEGTRIETTQQLVGSLEDYLGKELVVSENKPDGIVSWSSYIGKGPESYDLGYQPNEANSNYAHMLVNTSDAAINNSLITTIDNFVLRSFPNADIKVGPLGAGGGGVPIEIRIIGDNPDELSAISESVKIQLSSISGTKNVKDNWGPKSKKFVIKIDENRAQNAGISNQDIATSLQTVLAGFRTGEYREDDKSIPILMKSDIGSEQSFESLETLNIYSQSTGKSVPLLQVAQIIPEWQYSKIRRYNLNRTVIITSELKEGGNAAAITQELTPWLDSESDNWPSGYRYELGGDAQNSADNMGAVIAWLPLSGFVILLLLIIQFNSFRKMTMVILTIPLGIIGVVIGLLLFKEPFGFMPFLGVISLAGIIINNAIVLIDRIDIEQNEIKRSMQDSVIAACLQRFRPIVLATFTTVFGLIPLYLSGGEMWEGMAISIMVGLLFGTVITLIFIPSLYSILFKVNYKGYVLNPELESI